MTENEKELKDIKNLYRLLMLSIALQVIPFYNLQLFGFLLFMVVLIWAYVLKMKYIDSPFGKTHAVHVIKTIWNFSTFFAIGFCIWMVIMYLDADKAALDAYSEQIVATGQVDEAGIKSTIAALVSDNFGLAVKVGIPTLLPSIIYLIFRIWSGSSNASGERTI